MSSKIRRTILPTMLASISMFAKPAKALSFDHTIETTLSRTQLWSVLAAALSGDVTNGFWPTRYSTISGQVEENGLVTEIVFGTSTVQYRLSNVIPGQRLTYKPLPGEAMQGESHIEILPRPQDEKAPTADGSLLHWYGTYEVSALSPTGLTIRLYEQLFFRALKKNLQELATKSGS